MEDQLLIVDYRNPNNPNVFVGDANSRFNLEDSYGGVKKFHNYFYRDKVALLVYRLTLNNLVLLYKHNLEGDS